jgi:AmmeMemoRadiSam system protein A
MKTFSLSQKEKKFLLDYARLIISSRANNNTLDKQKVFSKSLKQSLGVFVTLYKNGQLRGCIGYVDGVKALQHAVEEMAEAAAFNDPRFPSVDKSEVDELEIEISVLSPVHTIKDIGEIEVGNHGLIIEQQMRRGLLLPQVAVEYNWNTHTFLEQTCQKAGLPSSAWKDPSTKIQIFSAEIFSEKDYRQ